MHPALMWLGILLMPFAAFFAVQLAFLPIIILTARLERRLTWSYLPLDPARGPKRGLFETDPSGGPPAVAASGLHLLPGPYTQEVDRAARRAGFRHLGAFADGKGKLYKLRYDFHLAPDRRSLALVGVGTIAGVPGATLWLFTRMSDGSLLTTLNQQAGSEFDLAGIRRELMVPNAPFETLLGRHIARFDEAFSDPILYSEADPLGDHRASLLSRVEELERIGAATFLDPSRNAWRYTTKGSVALALRMQSQAIRRLVRADR